jgi:BioD-like phosphotransacetylase family protein
MVSLYLASTKAAGKTAICSGLGRKLVKQGKKVGYFKPVHVTEDNVANKDVVFIKEMLELSESLNVLCPQHLSGKELWTSLTEEEAAFTQGLKKAYSKLAKGKDITLIEGVSGLGEDKVATLACYTIAEALDTKVIIVLRYVPFMDTNEIMKVARKLGQRLLGVILNFVPESNIEALKQYFVDYFEKAGIRILGVIPEIRLLLGVTVKDIASTLNGEIITSSDNADGIVENVMLGAMTPDSGIDYFSRKVNKAAVIRSDRADMQLAALETSTRCLVLAGRLL